MNESIYLGGWEVDFNDSEELKNFIIQHRLSKDDFDTFTTIQSGLEIKTENGKITEILNQLGNEKVSGPLDIPIPESEPHRLFWLRPSASGRHQLGGRMPNELKFSTNDSFAPIYLGHIDCKDSHFSWLSINKLHLFYPLDFYFEPTFVDYTNELNPELLSDGGKLEFRPKEQLSSLTFEATSNVTTEEVENEYDPIHQCGVPLWYQYPELPKCPKTGELMKFVCSISSTKRISVLKKGMLGMKKTDDILQFGDMGNLYVFFNPNSKIAYMTTQ